MDIALRAPKEADVQGCGRLIYEAFKDIAERHGFPPAFPSIDVGIRVVRFFIGLPVIWSRVAEQDRRLVGVIFLDEGDPIRGVAIVAVDPDAQRRGIGRALMQAALERARGARGVRLVQEAFNTHSMGLYASLGFEVKEPLVRIIGRPRAAAPSGVEVRPLVTRDLDECERLCERVHGITRTDDLRDAVRFFKPFACVRRGRITAFSYSVFGGHLAWGVAEAEEEMRALLIGLAAAVPDPLGLHLPTRQTGLLRWCLDQGFRIEKPLTLMALGEYHEPRGCYFPSGVY
ncbi:MAG: GNAT family N-acetyltransferase [Candidatus Rokuibacteriota bacterium]|nr:MAG: GNAT family N-acetyltransferase [Candidatus Rokubacteria bacterium]